MACIGFRGGQSKQLPPGSGGRRLAQSTDGQKEERNGENLDTTSQQRNIHSFICLLWAATNPLSNAVCRGRRRRHRPRELKSKTMLVVAVVIVVVVVVSFAICRQFERCTLRSGVWCFSLSCVCVDHVI